MSFSAGRGRGPGDRSREQSSYWRHLEIPTPISSVHTDPGDRALCTVERLPVPLRLVDILREAALRQDLQRLIRSEGREVLEGLCHSWPSRAFNNFLSAP